MTAVAAIPRRVLVWSIELYRAYISPTRMPSCRFEPTCSAYAVEAITTWGAVRGGGLAVWRLLKCGPWHAPGYDPVPERHPSTRRAVQVRASEERVTPC